MLSPFVKSFVTLLHTLNSSTHAEAVNQNRIIFILSGLFIGFISGFVVANAIHHKETRGVQRQTTFAAQRPNITSRSNASAVEGAVDAQAIANSTRNSPAGNPNLSNLAFSEDDLQKAIAKGDQHPNDIVMQRKIGQALYLYAMQANAAHLLPEAARFLQRANAANGKDYDTTVLLGNVLFELGQRSSAKHFGEARRYYMQALRTRPDDVDVRTDLGLTYFFAQPSDPQRAIAEYRRSLRINPQHEPTLQNLAAALISTGQTAEAERRISEVQSINSANPALPNLQARLIQRSNKMKEQPQQ